MDKATIYKNMYRRLFKISLFLFIIFVCVIIFFTVGKVKKPPVAFGMLDYRKDFKVASAVFENLNNSFIPREVCRKWGVEYNNPDEDFIYFKYYPKYQPLLDIKTLQPIEIHLYSGDDEIPIIPKESAGKPNLSWSFILDKKRKISTIEATAMTPNADGVAGPVENGVMIWKKGGIRQAIELPEGSKEFIVTARNASTFEGGGNLDPHMSVFLDALVIGDIFIRRKDLAQYVFNSYTESGWHKFSVEFDNAMYDQKSGWDSNLFVKDIQIYELLGGACLAIRKGMENKLINAQYQIAYFRPLKEENNNQLLRFFKNRFKIESLRSIIMGGYNVNSLIREVEIAGLIKKAIFAPAPTKIKLKLKVPNEGIKLTFGFAVMEEAWDKSGDGVEFVVRLAGEGRLGGAQDIIFSRYINPKTNTQDRKWFNAEVDLVKFKGEDISLIFETRGSPASPISPAVDEAYDWAVWSE